VQPLEIGFASGQDRLLLWLPMTMTHVIDETSPLSNWKIPEDALQDADATIVILVCKCVMVYMFPPPCVNWFCQRFVCLIKMVFLFEIIVIKSSEEVLFLQNLVTYLDADATIVILVHI